MRENGDERDTYIKDRAREQATDRERERGRERDDSLLAFCSIRVSEVEL